MVYRYPSTWGKSEEVLSEVNAEIEEELYRRVVEPFIGRRGYLALQMRKEGKTFREIGAAFEVCKQQGWNIHKQAMNRLLKTGRF